MYNKFNFGAVVILSTFFSQSITDYRSSIDRVVLWDQGDRYQVNNEENMYSYVFYLVKEMYVVI